MLLPRRPALSKKHHPALDYDRLPAFMGDLRQNDCISARALEFTILTAARTTEARMARIEEIDLVKAVWTVPAERMKRKIPHRVPLCPRAVDLVRALKGERESGLLFPGKRGTAICNMAMANLLPHMDFGKITVHGFRSTFRDWTGDKTGFSREVAEAALHHAVGDSVEQAYRRGDALDLRRQLMDVWGRYCAGDGAQIMALVA
jgi:integrase